MKAAAILADLDERIAALRDPATAAIRGVRREVSRALGAEPSALVLAIADDLIERDVGYDRFIAYELVAAHPGAMGALGPGRLRQLGRGMDSWNDVDVFACYVAGPAWRSGRVTNDEIAQWARSNNRWWRRTAVVCTVALNNKARGGSGDAARTVALCTMVVEDRDEMVVKALSWALRELGKREPDVVEQFIEAREESLAPRVVREVRTKLRSGIKSPRPRKSSVRARSSIAKTAGDESARTLEREETES